MCVSLPYIHTHTHIFMVSMVGGKDEVEALCSFSPLSASLNSHLTPSCLLPHIDPPSLSPDFTLRTKQLDKGEGFAAGPDLSCKKMTHLLKKLGKREKRQFFFGERKHKQSCFNMTVAGGTQRKVEEGRKRKIAYNTNPFE